MTFKVIYRLNEFVHSQDHWGPGGVSVEKVQFRQITSLAFRPMEVGEANLLHKVSYVRLKGVVLFFARVAKLRKFRLL